MCDGGPSTELGVRPSRREACVDVGAVELLGLLSIHEICVNDGTARVSDVRQPWRALAPRVVDGDYHPVPHGKGVHDWSPLSSSQRKYSTRCSSLSVSSL